MQSQRELQRLQNMVGQLSSVNQALATPEPGAAPAPAQPRAIGGAAPAPGQTGQLGTLPADQLPGDAGQAYSRARELLVADRLAEAEAAFEEFLRRFPDADTAADARFWFGRTLLARNNHTDAAASFVQYLERWPRGRARRMRNCISACRSWGWARRGARARLSARCPRAIPTPARKSAARHARGRRRALWLSYARSAKSLRACRPAPGRGRLSALSGGGDHRALHLMHRGVRR